MVTTSLQRTRAAGTVGIIGLGSRGIGVLERLVTLAARPDWAGRRLVIEVVDPDGTGVGIHAVDQPDHLLLNTVCAQVSLFPEEATVGTAVGDQGPNLYEWVTARGLKVAEDGYALGAEGRPVRPDDYLPRRVLGEYLDWFLRRLLDRVPENVEIRLHRAAATSLTDGPDDSRQITLDTGETLRVDTVFLTTGHTPPAAPDPEAPGASRRIHEIYPPAEAFADVTAGQTVALGGTGLSAMDVLASLTLGRGGRYEAIDDGLRYLPSGREPRILLFSRTGIPFRARPATNRTGGPYEPVVLTHQALDRLRSARDDRALDLHGDLLPLIRTEMRIAFHRRGAALARGTDAEHTLTARLRTAADEEAWTPSWAPWTWNTPSGSGTSTRRNCSSRTAPSSTPPTPTGSGTRSGCGRTWWRHGSAWRAAPPRPASKSCATCATSSGTPSTSAAWTRTPTTSSTAPSPPPSTAR